MHIMPFAPSYRYTADIVIALNPYRWFPDLYTDQPFISHQIVSYYKRER